MRIVLINQTFYPDVVSTGQHLADLACRLVERGHEVTVITSRRGYDDPGRSFPKREWWRGIRIVRVRNTGFGKGARWKRAANFASFLVSCCWELCRLSRPEVVVAMTSPPLVSVLAAGFARLRGARFCYWIMDLNPDEALAAGWLAPGSFAAKWLERFSRFSLRQASAVVVLDRFMQQRILEKGVAAGKVHVIPPWSHDSQVSFDPEGRTRLRKAHGLETKFLVMYSGNHSPCHPLGTVLEAAKALSGRTDIAFCFIGGGAEFGRVQKFTREEKLSNVTCLPYQPLGQLGGVLSAADVHLVVMGDPFVGIVHPCKVYNILRVGSPLLYIGPGQSHVTEMLARFNGHVAWRRAGHGEVDRVVQHILDLKAMVSQSQRGRVATLPNEFSEAALLPRMVSLLELAGSGRAGNGGTNHEAAVASGSLSGRK